MSQLKKNLLSQKILSWVKKYTIESFTSLSVGTLQKVAYLTKILNTFLSKLENDVISDTIRGRVFDTMLKALEKEEFQDWFNENQAIYICYLRVLAKGYSDQLPLRLIGVN